jgi:hypothetical protein
MRTGRGNRSTRSKPAPVPLCPPQIPHDLTRAAAVGSRRLTACSMERPIRSVSVRLRYTPQTSDLGLRKCMAYLNVRATLMGTGWRQMCVSLDGACSRRKLLCSVYAVTRPRVGRPRNRCSIRGRMKFFFSSHSFQTGSGARLAPYMMGAEGTIPADKKAECVCDQSPIFNAETSNTWSCTSSPHMSPRRPAN